MVSTEEQLINACIAMNEAHLEWDRIDREGEQFPRHLKAIESNIQNRLIDVQVLSAELANERAA